MFGVLQENRCGLCFSSNDLVMSKWLRRQVLIRHSVSSSGVLACIILQVIEKESDRVNQMNKLECRVNDHKNNEFYLSPEQGWSLDSQHLRIQYQHKVVNYLKVPLTVNWAPSSHSHRYYYIFLNKRYMSVKLYFPKHNLKNMMETK